MSLSIPETALPAPNAQERAASEQLGLQVRAEMGAAGGAISFARYMALALYAPGLGYYQSGSPKFGAPGDFTTAPESAPLFARCLAQQCQQILAALDGGDILEFGAGSGALAAALLLVLEQFQCLPERYFIMEISTELRQRQQTLLQVRAPHLLARVVWLEALSHATFRGVVLANEVLDAMPVQCFKIAGNEIRERCVTWQGSRFAWCDQPADASLNAAIATVQADLPARLPDGYSSELNPAVPNWIASLAARLTCGVILLIDYGYPRREYYLAERSCGTLLCHYRHRAHDDPLILTGLQDITAHVDFTAVAKAAMTTDLRVAGYTTQAHFLFGTGLLEMAAASDPQDPRAHLLLTDQIKNLTLPGAMGERFKVLALAKDFTAPLRGFALRDLRDRL